jgi:hypothetical protein
MRRIKSIESYALFVEREDIVFLTTQYLTSNLEGLNEINHLAAVLAANHHRPVVLINAAFQVELAHHLDTPQDRAIAYLHSKTTAEAIVPAVPAADAPTPLARYADILRVLATEGIETREIAETGLGKAEKAMVLAQANNDYVSGLEAEVQALQQKADYLEQAHKQEREERLQTEAALHRQLARKPGRPYPPTGWLTVGTFCSRLYDWPDRPRAWKE